ncbi:hypothetical protein [Leucobacter denitrificans]|uniref:Uncharacterized protein n=1 Tax=Leucobacter denitrificans TaxID=683042 RepID=A0A7G9S247_9MICO|nr:hypothetical protein [Leucobacter denitrificans]QNN61922.1 hypothetical protein H9L06_06225 [Leucobacter denitrificans]
MARIEVHSDRVVIRLTAAEKAVSLRRRDVVLDREAIRSAVITDDPWVWIRGIRAPGASLPGGLAYGTWRTRGGRDFVLARRGRSAVVIDLDVAESSEDNKGWIGEFDSFARVIISTVHAADLVRALRLEDADEPFRVDTNK